MTHPTILKKLLGKEPGLALSKLLAVIGEPVEILDGDGSLLLEGSSDSGRALEEKVPVLFESRPAGWVRGEPGSKWPTGLAALVEFLLARETEKRALAAEVLDKYRELHLLYRLSEKLIASLQPEAIAHMALDESCPLIQASGGMVLLKHTASEEFEILASCRSPYQLKSGAFDPGSVLERALRTGAAEISNDLEAGDYFLGMEGKTASLLCAPLKTEKGVIGVILLVGDGVKQFSAGDLKLLNAIAMQTAPAIEIAHLHQMELEKTRLERDLQMARQVQAGLLPSKMPVLEGWRIAAYWQPARVVSGDYYDFLSFPDGKLGLVVADVTDKAIPAALVMANTRSVLRAVASTAKGEDQWSPGKLLARANNVLCEDMPLNMFVTCLLVILDPRTGQICFANAGHNLPYRRTAERVIELRAIGAPLGIFPGTIYEEKQTILEPGESLLMYSDGLVEAHNAGGEMFGYPRLRRLLAHQAGADPLQGEQLIRFLMQQLANFTGPNLEQEDDVTFVTLDRVE